MGNCLGNSTFSTHTFASHQPQADLAPVPTAQPYALNQLPPELKAAVARCHDSVSSKVPRLGNRSFRQAGVERFTKWEISANAPCNVDYILSDLPAVRTITGLDEARLAQLAAVESAIRRRITHIGVRAGATDDGLAHLQSLPQLQSLDLAWCIRSNDAGLAQLPGLTNLQSLDLLGCHNITDAVLADLRGVFGSRRIVH